MYCITQRMTLPPSQRTLSFSQVFRENAEFQDKISREDVLLEDESQARREPLGGWRLGGLKLKTFRRSLRNGRARDQPPLHISDKSRNVNPF